MNRRSLTGTLLVLALLLVGGAALHAAETTTTESAEAAPAAPSRTLADEILAPLSLDCGLTGSASQSLDGELMAFTNVCGACSQPAMCQGAQPHQFCFYGGSFGECVPIGQASCSTGGYDCRCLTDSPP
jgi:hypothetical protein